MIAHNLSLADDEDLSGSRRLYVVLGGHGAREWLLRRGPIPTIVKDDRMRGPSQW